MTDLPRIAALRDRVPATGPAAVLATVVKVSGSAYRGPGARLLVLPDGTVAGSVGGGCLERDVIAHAEKVRATSRAELVTYDLSRDDAPWGVGARCGGHLSILLEPLAGGFPEHLAFLLDAAERRVAAVVAVLFHVAGVPGSPVPSPGDVGARLLLDAGGTGRGALAGAPFADALLADARAALEGRRTGVRTYAVPGGEAEVLVEFVPSPIVLVVCGEEGEAAPLMALAASLGWRARLLGRREPPPPLDARSAAVVMTHDDARDRELLAAFAASPARYVGLLGSRIRTALLLGELRAQGALPAPEGTSPVRTPAGLDIGAETPAEVALSIAAEIQAAFAGRSGGPLAAHTGRIHESR